MCKAPDTASATVEAAAVPGSAKQISANTADIRNRVSQHLVVTTVPATLPVGPKEQFAWINSCALQLEIIFSDLLYPIAYLSSMQGEIL